jgi:hypothetical protein
VVQVLSDVIVGKGVDTDQYLRAHPAQGFEHLNIPALVAKELHAVQCGDYSTTSQDGRSLSHKARIDAEMRVLERL